MSFPRRATAITGVYTTKQGRRLGRTGPSLKVEAIRGALDDAGLTVADVDGIVPIEAGIQGGLMHHMWWAEQLGGRPLGFLGIGQASGGVAKAAVAIAAGMCDVVVVFWANAGYVVGPRGTAVPTAAPRLPEWGFEAHGAYMSTWYAMWAARYMHEFGVTGEDLARVAVTHRHHATLNPASVMGGKGDITVEDVLSSRMIASPLHLLDCSIDNEGGYAIVVTSAAVARSARKPPVWILGGAEAAYTDFYATIQDPWFPEGGYGVRRLGDLVFDMAGVARADVDVAGIYDCFTITMLRSLEELGFCRLGEAAAYFAEGHTALGGAMPCNTDGGLLSNSHNMSPSGMHTIEVVRQLRGECGARQVPGASIGLSFAQGMSPHGLASALIMATG
jgi:acetyl-CoA C-acetyltransferase